LGTAYTPAEVLQMLDEDDVTVYQMLSAATISERAARWHAKVSGHGG